MIITSHLGLRPLEAEDLPSYLALLGDPDVRATYKLRALSEDKVKDYFAHWLKRWSQDNPFSAFTVFELETKKFAGCMLLGTPNAHKISSLACAFFPCPHVAEAIEAVIGTYFSSLIEQGHSLTTIKSLLFEKSPIPQAMENFFAKKHQGTSIYWMPSERDSSLSVQIETNDLRLSSLTEASRPDYEALFTDEETMRLYATGRPWEIDRITKVMSTWIGRWYTGDPFSAFTLSDKMGTFIGHIVLGHDEPPGVAALAYVINKAHWHKGWGTKAVEALIGAYAPLLKAQGFSLTEVRAAALVVNTYSRRILEKSGFTQTGTTGATDERYTYSKFFY